MPCAVSTDPRAGDALTLLAGAPNLVVSRTFSKAHALAGMRVGYLICEPGLAAAIRSVATPFGVNLPAQAAATAALLAAAPLAASAAEFINVLTGGTSGVYYPMGVAMSEIWGKGIADSRVQVQATKASVENLNLLQQGKGEAGFALGDSVQMAWEGNEEAGFKSKLDKLRAIDAASGIRDVTSLRWHTDAVTALALVGETDEAAARAFLLKHGQCYGARSGPSPRPGTHGRGCTFPLYYAA